MGGRKSSLFLIFLLILVNVLVFPSLVDVAFTSPELTQAFYPTAYTLLGETTYVSGSLTDLQSNNSVYMSFRSYISAFSSTANSWGFVAYRSNTGANLLKTPRSRDWNGSVWGAENEMTTAGADIAGVRVAYCPKSSRGYEKIVVTLSLDAYLDFYVWNGTGWRVFNNIGAVSSFAAPWRPFDVAYETSSGRALIVYDANVTDATKDLGYRIWDGTTLTAEAYINVTGVASTNPTISFVTLASNPDSASNQVAMALQDYTNGDAFASIWSGSAWGKHTTLTTGNTIKGHESIGVQYATYSKKILAVAGNGANSLAWKTYTQGAADWTAQTAFDPDSVSGDDRDFITLKADPAATSTTDYIMYTEVNDKTDLTLILFNANNWAYSITEIDDTVDTYSQRCADFDWEPAGSKGLVVWGTTAVMISYKTFTAPATWGAQVDITMGANIHPWVQLKRNPRNIAGDVKILGAVLEGTADDLGAIKWDGTTFTIIGTTTFTGNTYGVGWEFFDLEFQPIGPPSEYTCEIEFAGSSNTLAWSELVWTIDSAWSTASVTVLLQLYNYTAGAYPTTGKGYISYTSSTTPNKDETKSQAITVNPTHFRNATGNWKIKIKGVKQTTTLFKFKADLIEYKVTPVHDVSIISVTPSRSFVTQNQTLSINVTAKNKGEVPENFTVTAYYDNTIIGSQNIVNLGSYSTRSLIFSWSTIGIPLGTYTIKAVASTVPGETNTTDNTLIDGTVTIYPPPTVSVTPNSIIGPPPNINDVFRVNVTINNVHDLYAWQAGMTFNASVLRAINFTEGLFLKAHAQAHGQSTLWVAGKINNTAGIISYHGCTLTGYIPGANGTGTLGTITFNVTNAGNSTLHLIDVTLLDSSLTEIPCFKTDGYFELPLAPRPPVASFTFSPPTPTVGETVTFDASASKPNGGTITGYTWNFDDGNITGPVTNPIITHVYSAAGNYNVTLNVTDSQGYWDTTWKIVPVVAGYNLNLRILDWDLTNPIQGAYVYKDGDLKISNINGWANWTKVKGTVYIKVKWYGFWVNGTFSVVVNSDKTINVRCRIYDVTVGVKPYNNIGVVTTANVTVFNATSIAANKIRSGITANWTGRVTLINLPNSTLTFTVYAKKDYSIVIANVTRLISSDEQSETIIANQNYATLTLNWETIIVDTHYLVLSLNWLIIVLPALIMEEQKEEKKEKRR